MCPTVALATPSGNLIAWPKGHVLVPLDDAEVVDTTGAGAAGRRR